MKRKASWAAALAGIAGTAVAAGVLSGAGPSTAPETAAAVSTAPPAVPALAWKPCDDGFQCATAHVPLNYSDPGSAQISIAVTSHQATGPGASLGWLFFNGGGPEPQVSTFSSIYPTLPAALRERYDIVTFDPRGMGDSTQVRCYPTKAAEQAALSVLPDSDFPVGRAQEDAYSQGFAKLDARCAADAGPLLDHDSTADIARDMNLLREAVGARVLNFYGASYGTLLGAIYANLFPASTGRMILDGNIDPAVWSDGDSQVPAFSRIGSAQATQAVMTAFLNLCGQASTTACAFSVGTPAATTAKWNMLLRLVSRHPVNLGPQGTYTYADVVEAASNLGLVDQWQPDAVLLQQVWAAATGGTPSPPPTPGTAPAPSPAPSSAPGYYTGQEQQLAIQCADSPNPRDLAAYTAAAGASTFAPTAAWNLFGCADWPAAAAQDRYTGPWNRPTASTILVVGNTGDPWTPYQDSVAMSRELAHGRLLTVDGYGHTTGDNPSTCAINDMVNYAITGALPAPGTVCQQNATPFP
jgi:pimeloyl-ACP methyl ester carboxylesterase